MDTETADAVRIVGIDPGLNLTGYGVIDFRMGRPRLVEAGVVRGRGRSLVGRLEQLYNGVIELFDAFHPHEMAIEELYSHYARPRTAILMGHARGVICLAARQRGLTITPYAATQIKKILTGAGRAPKSQVQRAVQRELGLLQLPDPPDVADALAIALCHGYLRDRPYERAKD